MELCAFYSLEVLDRHAITEEERREGIYVYPCRFRIEHNKLVFVVSRLSSHEPIEGTTGQARGIANEYVILPLIHVYYIFVLYLCPVIMYL